MPMPGFYGMEHVGFTVPDINEACEFFERVLGAETLYTAATDFRHDDDDWMQAHLHVHPRAVIKEFRYLRVGNGTNFEDDIDAAIAFLKESGVEVLGEPTAYTEGPNLGLTWCYFMAPWGLQLEIVSAPGGTVYDNEAKASGATRLFNPKFSSETLL